MLPRNRSRTSEQRTSAKVWLQRVPIKDYANDALLLLHRMHNVEQNGPVISSDAIRKIVLPNTLSLLQQSFKCNTSSGQNITALWMSDGFLFDCSSRPLDGKIFTGELLFHIQQSRRMNKKYGTLLLASHGVSVPLRDTGSRVSSQASQKWDKTVDYILTGLYRNWRSIREQQEPSEHVLRVSKGKEDMSCKIPDVVIGKMISICKDRGDSLSQDFNVGQLNVHFKTSPVSNGRLYAVLGLSKQTGEVVNKAEILSGPYGFTTELHDKGVYMHGCRSLLHKLIPATGRYPDVSEVAPMQPYNYDSLIQSVRGMQLRTTYTEDEKLFSYLNVTHDKSEVKREEGAQMLSVYALKPLVQAENVCSREYTESLVRAGVPPNESINAALGAYAILAHYTLFSTPKPEEPVFMNSFAYTDKQNKSTYDEWKKSILESYAKAPTHTLFWFGQEVSVHIAKHRLGDAIVFCSDEQGVVAVAGTITQEACGSHYRETLETIPKPVKMERSLAAAAQRLAIIDTLCAAFPEFTEHTQKLRSVWLYSERVAMSGLDNEQFKKRMGVLSQLASLPTGTNFWSTVPYMGAIEKMLATK